MKNYTLALLLVSLTSISYAKEKKVQHDAHEHGVAEMNIVWEKNELTIELESPAYNITGFEHQPSTHEQEEIIEKIEKELNSPNELFAFKGASCIAEHIKIESPFGDDHGHDDHDKHEDKDEHAKHEEHDDHKDHDDHKKDDKHADHDDHKEHDDHKKDDKHAEHDDHDDHKKDDKHSDHDDHKDHDDHADEESTHSEYSISYEFHCEGSPSELTIETAELFKHLPQMEKIKVQWLSASTQSSSLLTKESNSLTLK